MKNNITEIGPLKIPTGAGGVARRISNLKTGGTAVGAFDLSSGEVRIIPGKFSAVSSIDPTLNAMRELSMNINALREDIQELTKTIKESSLLSVVEAVTPQDVLIYRDISKEQATIEISNLLQGAGQELYPSDISETLRIDYDLVTEILRELREQGKVEVG